MKVYVDELPKECFECPCFRNDIDFPCGLSDGTKDYFLDEIDGGECPLKSLAEYTKQVRKEVCQEIRKFVNSKSNPIPNEDGWHDGIRKGRTLNEFLDQIEGGGNVQN